jgi:Fe2+ or Zn2+ uptake regulation protein
MVRALPKNYERIFALVCELPPGVHRTAGELFIEAHARYPAMGVSTVYRGLTRLRDLGLIAEIQLPGASSAVYERAVPSHAHYRCSTCGTVLDVPYRLSSEILQQVAAQIDNPISDVSLTFHGTCQACSAA